MTDNFFILGSFAKGTIQPRPDQQERLEELTARVLSGEFHVQVTTNVAIPVRCVDGRTMNPDAHPLAPNAAGGTESLFVADDLTTKRFAGSDGSTLAGYIKTMKLLQTTGYEIGGHTDSHATGDKSGCGANDRLSEIYEFISKNSDVLRAIAADLGINVNDEAHELITRNATARASFSKGAELFIALKRRAHDDFIDRLEGDHNEVVAVINTRSGTTLNRSVLQKEFGDNYQAFNVDVWSFEKGAGAISETAEEVARKTVAMVYYNLATTMVLAGPSLRVIVLTP